MNIYRPNMQHVQTEAQTAQQNRSEGGNNEDLFINLDMGDNFIRLLPPWSIEGRVFKKVYNHKNLPPNNERHVCVAMTHPEMNLPCPICAVNDVFRNYLELYWSWEPTLRAYANAVRRFYNDPAVPQGYKRGIVGVSPGVYEWITIQMAMPQVGDITDPNQGIDLNINMAEKKGGGIQYSPAIMPRPCAIHVDPGIMNTILSNIVDLDKIFRKPDQAIYDAITACARTYESHLRYLVQTKNTAAGTSVPVAPQAPAPTPPVQQVAVLYPQNTPVNVVQYPPNQSMPVQNPTLPPLQNSVATSVQAPVVHNVQAPIQPIQQAPMQASYTPQMSPQVPIQQAPVQVPNMYPQAPIPQSFIVIPPPIAPGSTQPQGIIPPVAATTNKQPCFGVFCSEGKCIMCKDEIECRTNTAKQQSK